MHITNLENGNTATAIVRDSCPGCGVEDLGKTLPFTVSVLTVTNAGCMMFRHDPSRLRATRLTRPGCCADLLVLLGLSAYPQEIQRIALGKLLETIYGPV